MRDDVRQLVGVLGDVAGAQETRYGGGIESGGNASKRWTGGGKEYRDGRLIFASGRP